MPVSFFHQSGWLATASFLAGILNAVAGGGSFLSFPALLGAGVLPIAANATNTVALWPGQLTSIAAYREDLGVNLRLLVPVSISALLGGFGGAIVLLRTGQGTFLRLVPWLLLIASLLFAASGPIARWIARRRVETIVAKSTDARPRYVPLCAALVLVCFYIGYFGAGAGFLIMAALAIFGIQNIREVNALKVVATTIANGIAVVTFIVERQIVWHLCLIMMLTAAVGGYVGARYSRRLSARIMRAFVVVIGLGMAAYFFLRTP
jgi:uncharacterized membrane protein YfcA